MNNEFPFPKLLAFLESEADQVEFMKVCAEAGIGAADMELAKLLLALQLYQSFYAKIPRAIKNVHRDAIAEIRGLRDEVVSFTERAHADAVEIGQWAGEIKSALTAIEPQAVAELLHKRLVEESMSAMAGTVQALAAAQGRISNSTAQLNQASARAEASIYLWQTLTLRRVWISALACSSVAVAVIYAAIWFIFLRN
jgi:hypothetical protein